MMVLSVLMALAGRGVARRVRGVSPYILGPFADACMYLTTSLRGNISGDAEKKLALSSRDAQMLAALTRGDVSSLSETDLDRLQALIDTRMSRLALHWRGQALEAEHTVQELTNFRDDDSAIFGPIKDLSRTLIPATVFAADALPYSQVRLLNAGQQDGAGPGDQVTTRMLLTDRSKAIESGSKLAVINNTALVGRLGQTWGYAAQLILVTDRSFRMAAQLDRVIDRDNPRMIQVERMEEVKREPLDDSNNAFIDCLAEGNGSDGVIVRGVSEGHNIKPNDWLVVRISGSRRSTRIPIGQVVKVSADRKLGAGFNELLIKPMVDLSALREVFILVPVQEGNS